MEGGLNKGNRGRSRERRKAGKKTQTHRVVTTPGKSKDHRKEPARRLKKSIFNRFQTPGPQLSRWGEFSLKNRTGKSSRKPGGTP